MAIDTKTSILDTAERLFAERGYSATSLRKITAGAGVNLAAIHYHFHSKEALLEAVVGRRCRALNERRLEMLAAAPPHLERIIEAFVLPAFQMARDGGEGVALFARLLGRLYSEADVFAHIVKANFGHVFEAFLAAFEKALPGVPQDELVWRLHFTIGTMAHTLLRGPYIQPPPEERALIAFLSDGFRAPSCAAKRVSL